MILTNALFQKEEKIYVSVSVLKSTWKVMARDLHSIVPVLLGSIFLIISPFFFFLTKSWWGVEGTRAVKPSSLFLPICALRRWGS